MGFSSTRDFFLDLYSSIEPRYRALFSIEEIARERILQWMFGASLLFFYAIVGTWMNASDITIEAAQNGTARCWPYFQECYKFFFLQALPDGYSQTTFYMGLYAIMIGAVWCMGRKRWSIAHFLLLILFIWEALYILVFAYGQAAPYNYYHLVLTGVLLFVPHKEFFLKTSFVFMYFMSVTTKLDSTWVLGTYFTSLKLGLPILPDALTPLITNAVIFMQMVGSWFLLSRNMLMQRLVFVYFVLFHLYSGIFVLHVYPTVSLPAILILFGPLYRYTPIPFKKTAIAGVIVLALVAIFQLLGFAAPGDRRLTLEGNKFGMFMFEANHQCIFTVGTHMRNLPRDTRQFEVAAGTPCSGFYCLVKRSISRTSQGLTLLSERFESDSAWNRCYPHTWWSNLKRKCETNPSIERVSLTFDHSINGGAFYRIVDVPDICSVEYKTFGPNDWIRSPPEAPLLGYPVQNSYHY